MGHDKKMKKGKKKIFHLLRAVHQLYAALGIVDKVTSSTASSKNLENAKVKLKSNRANFTCALTTRSLVPMSSAILRASAADLARPNLGVGTPASCTYINNQQSNSLLLENST